MTRNPSQKRAIAHLSGPMMVLAGPGSGKTSVIVERTAYMIEKEGVDAASILVVTFSRAAAREMKERFLQFTGKTSTPVTFGTFHGIFYGILKQAYGFNANNILSEEEKYKLLHELILEYADNLADEKDFPEELSREISMVKGNRIELDHFYSSCCPDETFRQIYRGFTKRCRSNRKLDFDDMLLYCYELFTQREDILTAWQKKFRYILVDEFQDINLLQYDIIRMLAKPENNLFIVGDDDQSIYHFRGAKPEIMLNFTRDYKEAQTVLLDVNYRCSGNILNTSLTLIDHNKKRYAKKLRTPNETGEAVKCLGFSNPHEEYMEIAAKLKQRMEKSEDITDTALLLRTNQEAEGMVRALMERQIPFHMKEKLPNLFSHWICRDLLAYMHLANGDTERRYFVQIMNRPNRFISRDALDKPGISFEELQEYYKDKDWMCDRITTLQTHLRILKGLAPYGAVNFIRCGIGYEEYLREYAQYRKIKPEELMEILDRIWESAKGMKSLSQWEKYIQDYTEKLEEQARRQEEQKEGVLLSTLHGVKGLQFSNVYILNVNEGSIPYRKAVLETAVEEERRLFYVGLTRAKKKLTICYVNAQYEKKREPSRFIKEAGLWKE